MYAIIQTGGKQYKVEAGQTLTIEKLPTEAGKTLNFDEVLLVADGDTIKVGNPTVSGAKVKAEVVAQSRAKKIIVQKYRAKTRYRRKIGHRQHQTEVKITDITV